MCTVFYTCQFMALYQKSAEVYKSYLFGVIISYFMKNGIFSSILQKLKEVNRGCRILRAILKKPQLRPVPHIKRPIQQKTVKSIKYATMVSQGPATIFNSASSFEKTFAKIS